MFVAIQKIKTGEHIEQQETEQGIVDIIVPEYSDHLAFIAETREELENNDFITYDRIEEYEFAEMYSGVIYTNREELIAEKNKTISKYRESAYEKEIDGLHARKQRKIILGTWTETDEANYIEEVKRLSAKIEEENPYIV